MKKLLAALSLVLCTATLQAQDSGRIFADVYAECGIGAMIFNQEGSSSGRTLAIISNATWDFGTTAHASNASSEENCQGAPEATASFIYHNYDQIETDLVRGGGEYVAAMLDGLNCSVSTSEVVDGLKAGVLGSISGSQLLEDRAGVVYDTLNSYCTI